MITSKKQFDSIIKTAESKIDKLPIKSNLLFDLGFIFENGLIDNNILIVETDLEKSFYWYEQAMLAGHIDATLRLADFLSEGIGCIIDEDKAIRLYLICIEKGMSAAANNLATIYRDKNDFSESFIYYSLANDLMSKEYGKVTYSSQVALCYIYGIGVRQDINIGIKLLERFVSSNNDYSCQSDIDEANYLLGSHYLQGIGVDQDIDKARYYLLNANLDADHPSAQALLLLIGRNKQSCQ